MYRWFLTFLMLTPVWAADIQIDAAAGRKTISPFIYGRNNSLSDNPQQPVTRADWDLYRQAGVRIFRENGGNNASKYNWRRKLSSHPDWYNNVYAHNWDFAAMSLAENLPGASGMWAFQLLGKVAANNQHNFNDGAYNGSQWWEGVRNNWAGGGGPNVGNGNPNLYLMDWPPDSTVAILDHWFSANGLDLDSTYFRYWNLDNEPECWNSTHDDVMPKLISAEAYLQIYFEVAKKARAKFPGIKLLGPVFTNEWQWYNWDNQKIPFGNKKYTWVEYFIKRIGEEQLRSNVRLLDVLDFHFYPGETKPEDIVQLHRVWFDKTYAYPGANGVKRAGTGDWDESMRQEYIFERCRIWFEKYLGANHGVTCGVTEMGIQGNDPNMTAVWYASTLGVFADGSVEIFTHWSWRNGMWEVLHLFSRYQQEIRVRATSSEENLVSAYSAISSDYDSLSIILVNRELTQSKPVTVTLQNFNLQDGAYDVLRLNELPNTETFKSHTQNALKKLKINVQNRIFALNLPPLSITAVLLAGSAVQTGVAPVPTRPHLAFEVYPNPFNASTRIAFQLPAPMAVNLSLFDTLGRRVTTLAAAELATGKYDWSFNGANLASGVYFIRLTTEKTYLEKKVLLLR